MTVLLSWAYTSDLKADDTVAQIVNALLGLSGMLVILPWAIVLSPLIWTDEYQYGTLKQLFLHTSSRHGCMLQNCCDDFAHHYGYC